MWFQRFRVKRKKEVITLCKKRKQRENEIGRSAECQQCHESLAYHHQKKNHWVISEISDTSLTSLPPRASEPTWCNCVRFESGKKTSGNSYNMGPLNVGRCSGSEFQLRVINRFISGGVSSGRLSSDGRSPFLTHWQI